MHARFLTTLTAMAMGAIWLLQGAEAGSEQIARGKYIVEELAKCQDCHSPRLASGELDREHWLKGAVLDFAPMTEVKGWHKKSPDLTSTSGVWKRWGDEKALAYFQTGLAPSGKPAGPPMPAYHMTKADSEAILAYLKSLP